MNKIILRLTIIYVLLISNINLVLGGLDPVNGVSLTSVQLSSNNISGSQPLAPSVTIVFGLSATQSPVFKGIVIFYADNGIVGLHWDSNNLVGGNSYPNQGMSGDFEIQICVPSSDLNSCGIEPGVGSKQCIYSLMMNLGDGETVIFSPDEIESQFPESILTFYQNVIPPVLKEFVVSPHPEGPLVSFTFDIEYFGSGIYEITLVFANQSGFSLIEYQNSLVTNNGYYYKEILLLPEIYGTNFRMISLSVMDLEENQVNYNSQQIKSLFGVSTFNIEKGSSREFKLFSYNIDPKNPKVANGNSYTNLRSSAKLNSPFFPMICIESVYYICNTLYINSTYVEIYSQIQPNGPPVFGASELVFSFNPYAFELEEIIFNYNNSYTQPLIEDSSYSVSEINQLEPFYLEINYTIVISDAILDKIMVMVPSLSYFYLDSVISINNGITVSDIVFLFDSSVDSLNLYQVQITDSKDAFSTGENVKGPKTTPRIVFYDILYKIEFESTIFDFSNQSQVTIPFILTTWTNHSDHINSNALLLNNMYIIQSGMTNYTDLNSQIVSSNGVETVYQSYVTIYNNYGSTLESYGQVLLNFIGFSATTDILSITWQCFSIIPPSQPTIVYNFTMSPSNKVFSNQTSEIQVTIQIKGSQVNALQILPFLSPFQTENIPTAETILSICLVSNYNPYTLITDIQCTIPVANLHSQTILFYLQATILGQPTTIPNVQLQEFGYPSYISIIGPEDNGLVPNITQFSTSFNPITNSISVQYNIENECNFVAPGQPVDFIIFNRQILSPDYGSLNKFTVSQPSLSGAFDISLCDLPGFMFGYQLIGIYVNINSTILGTQYQFPYEYLVEMDPNQQNFPTNNGICDFSAPRLVDAGILYPLSIYDTSNQNINISVFYDITDDLSGFETLNGYIRLVGQDIGVSGFYYQEFTLSSKDIVSGNLRNGRFILNFTLPQYTNGTYQFGISSLIDKVGNSRLFTFQNILLVSSVPPQVNVYSDYTNPVSPSLVSVSIDNTNTFIITTNGAVSVYMLPIGGGLYGNVPAHPTSQNTYMINSYNPTTVNSGTYYFGICLNGDSLTTLCYTSSELQSLGLPNSIQIQNTVYYPPPIPIPNF
ncbi:hypothetical protein DLAC_09840 [Tieghemostelium lacteum]|uniref:Uncharacterized protein n=1 Tax=Tieghemostelium lacteum TaxID=361077 RepID=A0A151Z7C6_TIELA|nr:hypothetical protein DLAC_09840 [Tieghemostelium lacteum]|eukprot:KYQ89866.1 hypothetical protein DLAC_09840 [Tieghemostelium lacteum]